MSNQNSNEEPPLIIDDTFAFWAFGPRWNDYKSQELDISDMLEAWDELHGNEWYINPLGNIWFNLVEMRRIYDDLHKVEE